MWLKLGGLLLVTAALLVAVIPIRSRVVVHDVPASGPLPPGPSIGDLLGSMYLTPTDGMVIVGILAFASFVAVKVIRGQW